MLISRRIPARELSDIAHRLSLSLAAGVDLRRTWQREVESARGFRQEQFANVGQRVDRGGDWGAALESTKGLFPPLFIEMVKVGEQTGQTAEVLQKLSEHYRFRYELARNFVMLLAWPVLQLSLAVVVIGILIWVLGAIADTSLMGLGGNRGLAIYSGFVLLVGGGLVALVVAIRRGALWAKPLQRWVTSLPGLGPAIQKLCLARLTWTLHLLLNVDMDLRKVIPLVLRSTGNDYYIQHTKRVVKDVASGQTLHMALAHTGAFPPAFLDALIAAEESGQISESMARLSKQYEEEAKSAMKLIAALAAAAVWIAVGAAMIVAIFVLFTQLYLKPYQDLLNDM